MNKGLEVITMGDEAEERVSENLVLERHKEPPYSNPCPILNRF